MNGSAAGKDRRSLLLLAAVGAGSLTGADAIGQTRAGKPDRLLTEKDRLDVGNRGPAMVERARTLGREYEAKYGNCAQCTIAALQDAVEFLPADESAFLAGSCLSGGATASGTANCGGFTGAGIVIGRLCGRTRAGFSDRAANKLAAKLIREVAGKFEQAYGSVLCKDVREKSAKDCPEVVARAAGWAAEAILAQFSNFTIRPT